MPCAGRLAPILCSDSDEAVNVGVTSGAIATSDQTFVSEPLNAKHVLTDFSCGVASLDRWLREAALRGQKQDTGRTWIWHCGDDLVVAYFTLAAHIIERDGLSLKEQRSLPNQIPAILLAKLALDSSLQGSGLGGQLLLDALLRCVAAATSLGCRFVVVDAIDDKAAGFYHRFGFTAMPGSPEQRRLLRRLKDIRADLEIPPHEPSPPC
jgi:GNAT superfamily N-acetyltransferase